MRNRKRLWLLAMALLVFVSSVPAYAAQNDGERRAPVIVSNEYADIDFNTYTPSVSNATYTIDTKIFGTVATGAGKYADLVQDSEAGRIFLMEAISSDVDMYKGSINRTERIGLEAKVKFGDTGTRRDLFEVKSMTPPSGSPAWPTLIIFDQDGQIKNSQNQAIGTYAADQWYDVIVDLDTPNKQYSVWINGELAIDRLSLGNWVGWTQGRIKQRKNAANQLSQMKIARLKAGTVQEPAVQSELTGLTLAPLDTPLYAGRTAQLQVSKTPSDAPDVPLIWTSDDERIVQVDAQGIVTGVSAGTATVTVATADDLSIAGQVSLTVLPSASPPILVGGSLIDIDFSRFTLSASNNRYTIDSKFMGYIDIVPGSTSVGLADLNGGKGLYMEAVGGNVGAYKSAINRTDRIGIQTRVQFSDTATRRDLFEVKSTTPPSGSPAWPTLVVFDQDGSIKDYKNNVLGVYEANRWYDIVIDLDTPNHRYSAWIDGVRKIDDMDLGNWAGLAQSKITQRKNAGSSPSRMTMAMIRAGNLLTPIESLTVPGDSTLARGDAIVLSYETLPSKAYVEQVSWTSSNPAVAKIVGSNGLLATGTGEATITASEAASGLSRSFVVTVRETEHIWNSRDIGGDLASVLSSSLRAELGYTAEQLNTTEIQHYMSMSESELIAAVRAETAKLTLPNTHTQFETYARKMVQLYDLTDDADYARRAALILYHLAQDYPRLVVNKSYDSFKGADEVFPSNAIYAYGRLIESDIWGQLVPGLTAGEAKQTIERLWFRPAAYESIRFINSKRLNNIDPYGARSATVTAMLLNDPNLIREVIKIFDELFSGEYYYLDGMWEEGTVDYGDQVTNNVNTSVDALKRWTDPEGYADTELGLVLDKTDLSGRWPLLRMSTGYAKKLIYPDGVKVPVNDSYGRTGDAQPLPIVGQGLNNIETPGFGYFGLVQGDLSDATHAGLLYPAQLLGFEGSHRHAGYLSLTLWGAGTELLPDTGYINRTTYADGSGSTLRYPSMRPYFHNMPWVWRADGANERGTGDWQKPALLAYDPGTDHNKQVQVLEASSPGPEGLGAEMERRLLMMIRLDGNRSYTFDLTRLQGGQAHEIYQRGEEIEDMSVQTKGIELTATGADNLQAYLTSIGRTEGLSDDREQLRHPKAGSGSNSFSMTLTGEATGSSIRSFYNGIEGSDVFLSELPTARRVTTKAEETQYTTPQLVRRKIVADSGEITQFGAVHETYRAGQEGGVQSVRWSKPDDGDPMTSIAVVTSEAYKDIIYSSGDLKARNFDGFTFVGRIALVRENAKTGELIYSYVYGQGSVKRQGEALTEAGTQTLAITDTTTASVNLALDPIARENTITVQGAVYHPEATVGHWLKVRFGDGSGYGLKVKDARTSGGSTVFTVEQYTPFRLTDGGVQLLFSPNIEISGSAYVELDTSAFALAQASGGDEDSSGSGNDGDTGGTGNTDGNTGENEDPSDNENTDNGNVTEIDGTPGDAVGGESVVAVLPASVTIDVSAADLVGQPDGSVVISLPKSAEQMEIPAAVAMRLANRALTIRGDGLSLDIPQRTMDQLLQLVDSTAGEDGKLIFGMNPLPDEEAALLLGSGTPAARSRLKPVSDVMEFAVSFVSANGASKVSQFVEPIKLHMKLRAGADPDLTGLYFIADDGAREYVGGAYEDGILTAAVRHFSKYAALESDKTFEDLPKAHWAYDTVRRLAARQIVSGVDEVRFAPDRSVTRAEFAAMIVLALGLTTADAGAAASADVAPAAWYAESMSIAAAAGIVTGRGGGIFDPGGQITREEMTAMTMRAYAAAGGRMSEAAGPGVYRDAADISQWARSAIDSATSLGIVSGRGGAFAPHDRSTRADAAMIVGNLLRKI
ncbi:Uncharacterized conserved protein YjdB, contains Ig-like domain [Cohnella sp. OV330]|uniref:S-layer homology domain-containing protein n=1 Tax=Cohnella sp. OV330 TaxID=1855288 RepID=UPI0008EE97E3|nr:S-layer homology domain-containing protein [Cohnella sp. OV330]SFA98322.1 Uncharacterized conserved protein YjdB, contains Ig-like domain [Cohnella sp. OV330]